ncbi:class I SAM-dependent methyltransferase [Nostoc sphaeroides CHAB 2801]|uniref:class I SAM-dependent methyltransferase n=1 Tax=Nostoc sphaeroides TaxID=446679 RepID=UPI000E4C2C65|nr:class I SAM-dependent methyltransferase [Nostoc sphaeroides]MCC5629623.1 class I SAM-dependent methyltransferase [Nostoc sphaeroides CHAB 2801]
MQPSNVEINQEFWNNYAKKWDKSQVVLGNQKITDDERDNYINYLGDEWATVEDAVDIVNEYITPFIDQDSTVAEIGVGGGRIAAKVVEKVKKLYCFDVAEEMLKNAEAALSKDPQIEFHLIKNCQFEPEFSDKFDFVYSFDVFVHLDLLTIWKYLNSIYKTLKSGGRAFIHTTNITTPNGWARFAAYNNDEVLYQPTSPDAIKLLIEKSQFKVIKESSPDGKNFYSDRDYLVVIQK